MSELVMPPTLQFLFPMGGLGTRFAQVGIPIPKPLIPVDGAPMIHKALSSFDELLLKARAPPVEVGVVGAQGLLGNEEAKKGYEEHEPNNAAHESAKEGGERLAIRVVFVIRREHEEQFKLRTLLFESFKAKYGCRDFYCVNESGSDPSRITRLSGADSDDSTPRDNNGAAEGMSVYFVMMHADTKGAAETCLLAKPALILSAPVVILDCDLYVYSSRLNDVLLSMAMRGVLQRGKRTHKNGGNGSAEKDIPTSILSTLRGALVFFNSRAPRYSYAAVEPIEGVDLSDPKGILSCGGRVTKTAEKIPISNCSLIGAYTFATAGWFVAAAKKLIEQPINEQTGLKEYYISLLYNFLLYPSFRPENGEGEAEAEVNVGGSQSSDDVFVIAVPKEGYASFGTPEELKNYSEGRESYALE